MWNWGSNDGRGEYLSGQSPSLEQALATMRDLKLGHPDRYVHGDNLFHLLVARLRDDGSVGFVTLPQFAVDGDYDPPADALAYSAAELLALEAADALLVETDHNCPACGQLRHGYLANRSMAGASYFACLTCQGWAELDSPTVPVGHRSRPSSLAAPDSTESD